MVLLLPVFTGLSLLFYFIAWDVIVHNEQRSVHQYLNSEMSCMS